MSRSEFEVAESVHRSLFPSRARIWGVGLFLVGTVAASALLFPIFPFVSFLVPGLCVLYGIFFASSLSALRRRRRLQRSWSLEENGRLPAWTLHSPHFPEARGHLSRVGLSADEQEVALALAAELSDDSELSLAEFVERVRALS